MERIDLFAVIENRDWDTSEYQRYRLEVLGLHKFLQSTTFVENRRHRESIYGALIHHRKKTGVHVTPDIRTVERELLPERYRSWVPRWSQFCLIGYVIGAHQTYKQIAHPYIGDEAYERYLKTVKSSYLYKFPSLNECDYFKGIKLSEKQMEKYFCDYLNMHEKNPRRQVYCDNGIADVVTDSNVYEIKKVLTKANLNDALRQLLGYKNSRQFRDKHPVVVGEVVESATAMYADLHRYGVELIEWSAFRISKELNLTCAELSQ